MKKTVWLALGVMMFSTLLASSAFAGGWGPFFSWAREQPSAGFPSFVEEEVLKQIPTNLVDTARQAMQAGDFDLRLDHLTFGVLYDSAPSRDKLFNFRASLGFDFAVNGNIDSNLIPSVGNAAADDLIDAAQNTVEATLSKSSSLGGTLHLTFGFSPIRNELLKWWVGPAIRINGNYFKPGVLGVENSGTISMGGGAETGINLHVTPTVSMCLGGGVHWNAFGLGGHGNIPGIGETGGFVWGNGPFYFIQVAALYHTGEDQTAWQQAAAAPRP